MWLKDIAIGALSSGVNNATVVLLNASLLGCVGCLVFLLVGAVQSQSWLVPHLAFLLTLAIGLWLSVNWFVVQLGTTPPEQQQRELFGDGSSADKAGGGVSAAPQQQPDPQEARKER